MADDFQNQAPGLSSPAVNGAAVTPNDTTPLATTPRALYIGGAGDVAVTTLAGANLTFVGVLPGTVLPVRVTRVKATGTTATSILALW